VIPETFRFHMTGSPRKTIEQLDRLMKRWDQLHYWHRASDERCFVADVLDDIAWIDAQRVTVKIWVGTRHGQIDRHASIVTVTAWPDLG